MSLINKIDSALEALGKDPTQVSLDDIAPVDQFHVRGTDAIADLVADACFQAQDQVLDLGCGSGGPARYLASKVGCNVIGFDLSEEAVAVGNVLSERTALSDLVHLHKADAVEVPAEDATFTAGFTVHVGMFVADKKRFYGEAFRLLKPGSRFVVFDPVLAGETYHDYPVPWARTANDNHIGSEATLLGNLRDAGFEIDRVIDRTQRCITWFQERATQAAKAPASPPLGLNLVVGPDFPTMIQNAAKATLDGRLRFCEIHAVRPQ